MEHRLRRVLPARVEDALRPTLGEHVAVTIPHRPLLAHLAAGHVPEASVEGDDVPIPTTGAHLAHLRVELHGIEFPRSLRATRSADGWRADDGSFVARIDAEQLLVAAADARSSRSEWLDLLLPFVRRLEFRDGRIRVHLQVGYFDTTVRLRSDEVVLDLAATSSLPRLPRPLRGALPLPPWHVPTDRLPAGGRLQSLEVGDTHLEARGTIDGDRLLEPAPSRGRGTSGD